MFHDSTKHIQKIRMNTFLSHSRIPIYLMWVCLKIAHPIPSYSIPCSITIFPSKVAIYWRSSSVIEAQRRRPTRPRSCHVSHIAHLCGKKKTQRFGWLVTSHSKNSKSPCFTSFKHLQMDVRPSHPAGHLPATPWFVVATQLEA